MDILEFAEYVNTGGNCYVMFACVETGEIGNPYGWLAGSVDAGDCPIIQWYETREDAYNCDAEHGFIREVRRDDPADAYWFDDLWLAMFIYAIEHGTAWDKKMAIIDAEKYFGFKIAEDGFCENL